MAPSRRDFAARFRAENTGGMMWRRERSKKGPVMAGLRRGDLRLRECMHTYLLIYQVFRTYITTYTYSVGLRTCSFPHTLLLHKTHTRQETCLPASKDEFPLA